MSQILENNTKISSKSLLLDIGLIYNKIRKWIKNLKSKTSQYSTVLSGSQLLWSRLTCADFWSRIMANLPVIHEFEIHSWIFCLFALRFRVDMKNALILNYIIHRAWTNQGVQSMSYVDIIIGNLRLTAWCTLNIKFVSNNLQYNNADR